MSAFIPQNTALVSYPNCFALLDDAQSDATNSRFYSDLQACISCTTAETWTSIWQQAQLALQSGLYVLAVLSYETGAQLQAIEVRPTPSNQDPVSYLLIFKNCDHWTREQVSVWLDQQCLGQQAGVRDIQPNIDEDQFTSAINQIRAYIAAGDTYQVNFTYRLHFQTYGSGIALYRALRLRQPVPFAAFIAMPDDTAILSLSPELFVRHQAGQLLAKPMKGTAAASKDQEQNLLIAEDLRQDPKNRAENLMIVDLLRNDLGRIAQTGSVAVPVLFEVQRFSSVLQMTSTVTAQLRPDLGLDQIMSALFPCGSITGAPKRRTMEIIREIETENRGVYTGAIGWFDPPSGLAIGDFCLSVPIRTLVLQKPDALGCSVGVMGVGAGVVYDSQAQDEFKECALKARFLTGLKPDFELFETMYANRENGCRHVNRHLDRLAASANYFEFSFDRDRINQQLQAYCQNLAENTDYRLRLAINVHGEIQIQHSILKQLAEPVQILVSSQVCDVPPIFLSHKSSHRQMYDQAWQAAEQRGCFDTLFINAQGLITEGGRCNIFVKLDGRWYTPPLSDGVLPGVMRQIMLEDTAMQAQEKSLSLDNLQNAEQVIVCNALRGAMQAKLVW